MDLTPAMLEYLSHGGSYAPLVIIIFVQIRVIRDLLAKLDHIRENQEERLFRLVEITREQNDALITLSRHVEHLTERRRE